MYDDIINIQCQHEDFHGRSIFQLSECQIRMAAVLETEKPVPDGQLTRCSELLCDEKTGRPIQEEG